MKKFSKLIAVVLAIAVIICPMMSVVSHATTTNGYKIEANPNDANELMLTISSTDGFVAYDATVTFNSTDAFQDDCNTGDYVDGLRLISYEVDGGEGNSHNLPRIYSSMPNDTTLKMIVIKNDFSATGMYTELVIGIRVAAGSTATLTKIQAADEGTVADDPTLLTFPAANESTGEIDQTDEYAKENATITVHTHDLTLVPANDPTCTDDGNYAYYTCSGCDKIFSDSQGTNETTSQAVTRPATGHTWGEYVSNNDATCTADGTKKRTCSECGATETITDVGSALGHTPATAVVENNVPATCTTDGSYDSVVKCSVCKTELSRETVIVKATGHTPATAVEENRVEATCGVDGHYDSVVYCSVCKAEISRTQQTIPATGAHTYTYTANNDGTHTVGCANCDYSAQETCDTAGTDGACSKCGYKAVAHVHVAGGYVVKSKTSEAFTLTYTCTECGEEYDVILPIGDPYAGANIGMVRSIDPANAISVLHYFNKTVIDAGGYTNLILQIDKEAYYKNAVESHVEHLYYTTYESGTYPAVSGTRYFFNVSDVAPYEMGNALQGYLYGKNEAGEMILLKTLSEYSILTYVNNHINDNAQLGRLLVDLLNYGAACQTYGGFNVANLVNAGLTDEQRALATPSSEIPTTRDACFEWTNTATSWDNGWSTTDIGNNRSLLPEEKVKIIMGIPRIKAGTSIEDYYCTFSYYDVKGNFHEDAQIAGYDPNKTMIISGQVKPAFIFEDSSMSALGYPVTMKVYYGNPNEDGIKVMECQYSIETYIARNIASADAGLSNLMKTMYAYGYSCAAYANVTSPSILFS